VNSSADGNLQDHKARKETNCYAARVNNEAAVCLLLRQPNIALGICDEFAQTVLPYAVFTLGKGIVKLLMDFSLKIHQGSQPRRLSPHRIEKSPTSAKARWKIDWCCQFAVITF
jgi:hypothetical protein